MDFGLWCWSWDFFYGLLLRQAQQEDRQEDVGHGGGRLQTIFAQNDENRNRL